MVRRPERSEQSERPEQSDQSVWSERRSDAARKTAESTDPFAVPPSADGDPSAESVRRAGATGDGPEHSRRILDPLEVDRFQQRWHDIQAGFVDDPREALRRADQLAAEMVDVVDEALDARKQRLDEGWYAASGKPADTAEPGETEQLRVALRGYRDFVHRILTV